MKREESRALQGIAVLLMLFHHFFIYSWMFEDVPGFLRHPAVTEHLAWCGRICVGLFSFISGYGMYHALKGKESWKDNYAACLKRALRLYLRLWTVLALYLILWPAVFHQQPDWGRLPWNLTAMDPDYNPTWWFVREYFWMLLCAPLGRMVLLGNGRQRGTAVGIMAAAVILAGALFVIPGGRAVTDTVRAYVETVFLIIFAEGALAAHLWERVRGRSKEAVKKADPSDPGEASVPLTEAVSVPLTEGESGAVSVPLAEGESGAVSAPLAEGEPGAVSVPLTEGESGAVSVPVMTGPGETAGSAGKPGTGAAFTTAAGLLILIAAGILRYISTPSASFAWQDIVVVPLFCLGAVPVFRGIRAVEKGAAFFGKHSLYLWLVHGLVWQRTFNFAKGLGHPVLYYLFELGLSLAVAILLGLAERTVMKLTGRKTGAGTAARTRTEEK